MSPPLERIAIIGAGLAGTALALALHQHSIACTIYESRTPADPEIASGVLLTPNGLIILRHLGVFDRITSRCWKSDFETVRNDRDELVSQQPLPAPEGWALRTHRVWRRLLLDEMRTMLQERGVQIRYGCRFEAVIREDNDGVSFRVAGEDIRASLLVGADGIHSTVRRYISGITPQYTGILAAMAHCKHADVDWPATIPSHEGPLIIQGNPGALVMIPEDEKGHEIIVARQVEYPDQGREGWARLGRDVDFMCDFFREGYEGFGETARKIIDVVSSKEVKESLYLWPLLKMPRMESWCSTGKGRKGRVLVVGDAAHAVPPSSAQGVNQALEDVWSLVRLLTHVDKEKAGRCLEDVLRYWQSMRQERIDGIMEFVHRVVNVQRMPEAERRKLSTALEPKADGVHVDREWVFRNGIEEKIEAWKAATA